MKKEIKKKISIGLGSILIGLLICYSIQKTIELSSLNFASPETPRYVFGTIVIWVLTILLGRYLYKNLKK